MLAIPIPGEQANGYVKRPARGRLWKGITLGTFATLAGGSHKVKGETHSQAPIKDGKKFLLKEVEFHKANTTDTGKLGIGGKGVAECF